ncbi:hypothetical protein BDF20DRAFT_826904 [Mycotypha africana]|uniref:uncharacterized protein n=1 Tax=Mycotypha africana TaxID=64632 RepID=UPI00230177C2|nr:uncharacterized protein BDF20DRAFT_826904 [Mycotypha africana]KAI8968846.1 hypothetical protein BDF20DRAFT_826904 [Mycotypha africana]
MSLQNKTIVITGASRGLGLEFVKQLSAAGNVVFAGARHPDQSKELQELAQKCDKVHPLVLDISEDASIQKAVEEVSQKAHEGIDILINNAGKAGPKKTATDTERDEFIDVLDTNVVSVARNIKFFLPLLQKRGKDHLKKILNVSSIAGSMEHREEQGSDSMVAYATSKAALNMMIKAVANQLKEDNVVVFLAHPGWVATDMGGDKAPVQPQDSIRGLLKVLNDVTTKDNGKFYDYKGKQVKW